MNKQKRSAIILIALIVALSVPFIIYKIQLRKLPQVYVSGRITRIAKSPTAGYSVKYIYSINNARYSATRNLDREFSEVQVDENYLVAVPFGHDNNGLMLFCCLLPDTLVAPDEGWSDRPAICRKHCK